MKITALDIHQKEFSHGMRGYRENEVDDFLDVVAAEVDRLSRELDALSQRAASSEMLVKQLEGERDAINGALLVAQRSADDMVAKAEVHSRRLVSDAQAQAEEIVHEALNTKRELMAEIRRLKEDEIAFRDAYRDMLEASLLSIEEVRLSELIESEMAGDELGSEDGFVAQPSEYVPVEDEASDAELVMVVDEDETEEVEAPEPVAEQPPVAQASIPAVAPVVPAVDRTPLVAQEPVVDAKGQPLHSFIIGETASQAPVDTTLSEPSEFKGSAFAGWGDREEDIDIEEID